MLTTSATGGPGGCSSFCGPVGFSGDVVGSTAVGKQSGGNTEDEDRDYESIKGLLRWDSDPDLKEMPNTPTFGASASAPSISAEDAAAAASLHQGILSTLRELQLPTDGLHSPSLQLPQSLAAPGAAESLIMNDDFMQGVSELHFGPGGLSDPTGLDHGYLLRAVDPRNQYRSSHHPNHSLDHHNQQQQHHHHHNHGNRNPHQTELISTLSADAAVLSDSLDTTRLTSSTLRQDFLCPTVGNDSGGDSVGNGSSGGGPPSGDSIAGHGHQGHLMSASAAAASASYPGTAINPQRAIGGSMGWDTNMLTELRTGFPAQSAAMVRPPGTGAAAAVTSSASSGRPRRMSRQSSSVQRLTSVSAAISRQNSPMIAGVGFGGIGGAKASAGSGASRGSSKRGNNQNVSGEPYPTLGSSKSLSKRVPQGLAGVSSCSSSGTSTAASVRSGSGADRSNKIIEMEDLIRQNTALRIQVAEAQAEREREEAESGKMLETLQLLMSMRR